MPSDAPDPTTRFSSRVANYVKYRPGYPTEVIDILRDAIGLGDGRIVADIGSGTGLSAKLFLESGCRVCGVEPNEPMRKAAEELLGDEPAFVSVAGTAEATTLEDASIDVIVAAQAFHWFDRDSVRREFSRILRPEGWVVLMWNERRLESTPFLAAFERLLLEYAVDYGLIRHENVTDDVIRAFLPNNYSRHAVYNEQVFDFDGLRGRTLSASYMPGPGHPGHEPMLEALRALFDRHQSEGRVVMEYDTVVHFGRL